MHQFERETTMGKAAENERRKLRATFWNNVGAGVAVAAIAIPYIGFVGLDLRGVAEFVVAGFDIRSPQGQKLAFTFVSMGIGVMVAETCRRIADRVAGEIED